MLPFLKSKQAQQTGVIIKERAPDQKEESEDIGAHGIEACAEEFIRAVHAKDVKAAAAALKDAFEILESQPHEEGPHTYDAQNEKAAE